MAELTVRRRGRERALQFLYGLDFTKYNWQEVLPDFWRVNESKPGVRQYAQRLIRGVMDHRARLDETISAALENWTIERLGKIERNIIRIALYEILYCDDVPDKVAVNEAIEVAKNYGSDETPRFVNGVLDRLMENESRQTAT